MKKKRLLLLIPLILAGVAPIFLLNTGMDYNPVGTAEAAAKKIEIYRTTTPRLTAVEGQDYKKCHLNSYTDVLFTNSENYTHKGSDGKYEYYATLGDGARIYKGNHATYGSATRSLTKIKLNYTPSNSEDYIQCLTSFNSEPDTGLTPANADLSYDIASGVNTDIVGNYFTLISHGEILLNSINISYGCESEASKDSEVITCNNVDLEVGDTTQLNPTSSFGSAVSFSYQSLNTNVVTVTSGGLITAVSLGKATIRITSSLGNFKDILVDVSGQIYATLLNDSRVFGDKTKADTVYSGASLTSLNATRKGSGSTMVCNHIYYKFNALSILNAYDALPSTAKSDAKIHLKIYAKDSLANFTSEDVSTMDIRGYNPSTLYSSYSDSSHGSCQMIDWDPDYITWNNVKSSNNIPGYLELFRNNGVVIAKDSSSTLDCDGKVLDLYFPYSSFASYIYKGEGAYKGYVTFSFDYSHSDKTHDSFVAYSSSSNYAPTLSLVSNEGSTPTFDEADVFIYMGQSNMAGRGEAIDSLPCLEHGYEYHSVTGTPGAYITNLVEPFGKYENNEAMTDGTGGDGNKSGGVVSSFIEGYYSITGVPIIGIAASVGATSITKWQAGSTYLAEAVRRLQACIDYIYENESYTVRHINMVWCQGESDAGNYAKGSIDYFGKLQGMVDVLQALDSKYAIDKCYLIPLSIYTSGSVNANKLALANDQIDYCTNHPGDFALASKKFFNVPNSMRDDPHFHQGIYNVCGYDAGIHVGQMIEGLTVSAYNEFIPGEEITLASQYNITLQYHT